MADTTRHTTTNRHADDSSPPRALILAAGQGSRLLPLTAEQPKCLVEVAGEPLLERSLRMLAGAGVEEAVVVVGFCGDLVRQRIGTSFAGISVEYVEAPEYATTNNLRSLWDARAYLDRDTLLLEADLIYDREVVTALLERPSSSAAVVPYQPEYSGTVVTCDGTGRIARFVMGSEQDGIELDHTFKTVNIYLLRSAALDAVRPRLETAVEAGRVDDYYETVFRDAVAEGAIRDLDAVDVSSCRWYEVDDERDLDAAEFRFMDRDAQYDRIQRLHGSYWRYGFRDHSYLYNLHFPPPEMIRTFKRQLPEIVRNYPVGQGELAGLVARWTGAPAERLAVANGASELIKVLGAPSPRVTIPTPSFNEYEEVVAPEAVQRFPLRSPDFDLDVREFARRAIEWRSELAVVVTPNNPTARSVPPEDLLWLASRLEAADCRMVVDESFIEFSEAGAGASLEPFLDEHPNLVVMKSMSKVFGIAGLRLGYLMSADLEFVRLTRAQLPIWNVNGLAEDFLRTVGAYRSEFEESCRTTRSTYLALHQALQAVPGLECLEPDANFVLCRLTDGRISGPELARRLYVQHNILIKDCANKSMPDADRYLRIASRTREENRELVARLTELLGPGGMAGGADG